MTTLPEDLYDEDRGGDNALILDHITSEECPEDLYLDHVARDGQDVDEPENTQHRWKASGTPNSYRLNATGFVEMTKRSSTFDAAQALEMLQTKYTMDYGSKKGGSRPAKMTDNFVNSFYLDYISVIGRPMKSITRDSARVFDNITISFQYWHMPYSAKHIATHLPFSLKHRTFQLARASSREVWYIVMQPSRGGRPGAGVGGTDSTDARRRAQDKSSLWTALETQHADLLAGYIRGIFQHGDLLGEGVEVSWRLGGPDSRSLSMEMWKIFQDRFMEEWNDFTLRQHGDPFWDANQPTFHTYDYGANIHIEVTDGLERLEPERDEVLGGSQVPWEDDSDITSEEDSEFVAEEDAASVSEGLPAHIERPGSSSSSGNVRASRESSWQGFDDDDDDDDGDSLEDLSQYGAQTGGPWRSPSPVGADDVVDLYGSGLMQLRDELELKYELENIHRISYALAVNMNCTRGDDGKDGAVMCLLSNRNHVSAEYSREKDYTFYPLGFNPAYGNFSSQQPPRFLDNHLLEAMSNNMRRQNNGAGVLSFGYFQGYSNIKRSIRSVSDSLLASKGFATAALTVPDSIVTSSATATRMHQRLLQKARGLQTPDRPLDSKPFSRERQLIENTVEKQEFAFRMEQVVSVEVSKLARRNCKFAVVLHPIFQLIRFFLRERDKYVHLLRIFKPAVFPGVLGSFARIFELAMDDLHQRYVQRGPQGLGLALSEAVAAIDRLGNFCFTGDTRALPSRVFSALGTMQNLKEGGWPYIDPSLLDFRAENGYIHPVRWPATGRNGQPVMLHVASVSFYYGSVVAARCQIQVRFSHLNCGKVRGRWDTSRALDDIFRQLWTSETVAFLVRQLRRRLSRDDFRSRDTVTTPTLAAIEAWASQEKPFLQEQCWELLGQQRGEPSGGCPNSSDSMVPIRSMTLQDYSEMLYEACTSGQEDLRLQFSQSQATWFIFLQAAIRELPEMSKREWGREITGALVSASIDWVPDWHSKRLTSRSMIRLVHSTGALQGSKRRGGELLDTQVGGGKRRKRRQKIDFGCEVPFTQVPSLIEEGFTELKRNFRTGDVKVLSHYQVAYNCLIGCLGDPLCDLMLLLVLTFCSSSVTPDANVHGGGFRRAARRRAPAQVAMALITRMLWYLRPEDFPWAEDNGDVLRVSEMVKKLEHKATNNRVLCELGWVSNTARRTTPRLSELRLRPQEELLRYRSDLLRMMKRPSQFILAVFGDTDDVWVGRCESIIREY